MADGDRWAEIDRLVSEQKLQAALELAEDLLAEARAAGDAEVWTRALIRAVQLRTGLHGYETAVRFLRQESWPEEPLERAVLDLFYAQSLVHYLQAYSWEIGQRERMVGTEEVDLKAWTRAQILEEINRSYLAAWEQREAWGERPVGDLEEYVQPNSYPRRIRGTLRDAVSYLWVGILADESFWEPAQSNGVYRLDLGALIEGEVEAPDLSSPAVHPLVKLAAVLGDLEAWHAGAGRIEAAFEARRERLSRLHDRFDSAADRTAIRSALQRSLEILGRQRPWWAVGQATLAEMVRAQGLPDSLVQARKLALEGVAADPTGVGGQRCRSIVSGIEAPAFSLQAMGQDGPSKRSIAVSHKNLERLYFRAYRLDLRAAIEHSQDYNLLPGYREIPELVEGRAPDATWSTDLPATRDFQTHRTFVTPPLERPGLWVVAASARQDFAAERNRRSGVALLVTDLVLVARTEQDGWTVTARSGESGAALAGAKVDLYRFDYRRGHRVVESHTTGDDGRVHFAWRGDQSYFLVAEHQGQLALDRTWLQGVRRAAGERTDSLLYTDRSIYRPGQQLLWKVVAYHGVPDEARFQVLTDRQLEVELHDANGELVETAKVTTNDFGSASGAFAIPTGRLLGAWSLRTSLGGGAAVRVEEYKRPTFEVELLAPEQEMRLNRETTLRGEARYYFGLPVVTGEVSWRVERSPVYPPWWEWWGWRPARAGSEIVAAGESSLAADGGFELSFVPAADEREAESGVSYSYRVEAELTDEGGETRSASRSFRLGFVAVRADLTPDRPFVAPGEPLGLSVLRTDLDGAPRAGSGSWRLVALRQPSETLLPADQPLPEPPAGAEYQTPGDRLRPRWSPGYTPEQVLRLWPEAREVEAGTVEHDAMGRARIEIEGLAAGAYRLEYSTTDRFGARFDSQVELVVAAAGSHLALPAVLWADRAAASPGENVELLVHSGLPDQQMVLEVFRRGGPPQRRDLGPTAGVQRLVVPVGEAERGGFTVRLSLVRDHQLMTFSRTVWVPWNDRRLTLDFSTFRDRLRPGDRETWTVTVHGPEGAGLEAGTAELLAYMYDRSLDVFAPHTPPDVVGLYPSSPGAGPLSTSLGAEGERWQEQRGWATVAAYPGLSADSLKFLSGYGIGGPGGRYRMLADVGGADLALEEAMPMAAMEKAPEPEARAELKQKSDDRLNGGGEQAAEAPELRTDFSETAFWKPHLLLGEDGAATFEFEVPDSVTEWNVWVHALTRDLMGGSLERQTRTVKELLVRPYVPRFLREGDRARLRVVVNNAGDTPLRGTLDLDVIDPSSEESLLADFGLDAGQTSGVGFTVEPGAGTTLEFPLTVPARVGQVAFRVVGRAGQLSDGELRPLPVLPGRFHLAQSRFVTLRDADRRELHFADLAANDDPTRIDEQLVVTLDAQLFYSVLSAVPYLVEYPYECTEQTLNRFLSTGILTSLFEEYPAVARMAKKLSQRETRLEPWLAEDPNRLMSLEETPWLRVARGGDDDPEGLIKVLDPRIAKAQRESALAKLEKAQTSLGGFPWWSGGPPSPHMTLYLLMGFSRALEFGVEVPQEMVRQAWAYTHRHFLDDWARRMVEDDCCWEQITFLNYVLSSYPDASWTGGVFSDEDRRQMLDFSFRHWRQHSPLLKGYLALTLERADRDADARLVFDSVMDSARTTEDLGTFWAPEDRAWLWYNDTIETHAFALRTLSELDPDDPRRDGLVQWLLLNKKLNHWKSTRATAEVIYSLVHYLEHEGQLGTREEVRVAVGPRRETFTFEPDEYTGRANRVILIGDEIDPATTSTVVVEKDTPGFAFASATWHFSTEKLPAEARGDFFRVERSYFRRLQQGDEWQLRPLAAGDRLEVGDQVEVHLSIRTLHAAEYVHLRDPRGAGFEPESLTSGYKWDLGVGWYEEVRDSGTNFFFEWLPAGEYTFKYRVRAAMGGTFKVAPAVLQSMYAPEFVAYSAGAALEVSGESAEILPDQVPD